MPVPGRTAALALAAALLGAWVGAMGEAAAQAGSATCRQLEARLRAIPATAGGGGQFAQAAQRQRGEIATMVRYQQSLGCGPGAGGQCAAVEDQIRRMRANLAQLEARAGAQGGGSVDRAQERARLVAALDANGCRGGAAPTRQAATPPPSSRITEPVLDERPERQIYQQTRTPPAVAAQPQTAYRTDSAAPRNFIEFLFGRRDAAPSAPSVVDPALTDPQPRIMVEDGDRRSRNVGHRTICVRLCDGAFFPMTSSQRPGGDYDADDMCQLQCPGADVEAFRMVDGDIENAVSLSGQSYMSLPNALRFRRAFDRACACRPPGQGWAEAMAGRDDPTLRSGDVVVSAEQARLLSLPEAQRRVAREELAAAERERREADRRARAERRARGEAGAPRETVGLDGAARPAVAAEPPAFRGAADPTPTGTPARDEPPVDIERRPVRVIVPAPPTLGPPPGAPAGPPRAEGAGRAAGG